MFQDASPVESESVKVGSFYIMLVVTRSLGSSQSKYAALENVLVLNHDYPFEHSGVVGQLGFAARVIRYISWPWKKSSSQKCIRASMVNSSFMKKNGHHNSRGETNLKERFLQVSSMVLFGSFWSLVQKGISNWMYQSQNRHLWQHDVATYGCWEQQISEQSTWKWWFPKGISFSTNFFSGSILNFWAVPLNDKTLTWHWL